jgi:hypothetical protein
LFFINTCFFVEFDFVTYCQKKTAKADEIITQWKRTSLYIPTYNSDYKKIIEQFLENPENFKTEFHNDNMTSIIRDFCASKFFQVQKRCVTQVVTGYQGSNTCYFRCDDDDDDGGNTEPVVQSTHVSALEGV